MKQTKTLLAFLAVLTFTAKVYCQSPYDFSATAPSGQTLYYKIIDSTQVGVVHPNSSGSNSGYATGDLVIPDSVSYCGNTYTVTQLITHHFIQGAFTQCSTLTSVYIPNTVKNIGDYSFTYCNSLVSVHLPDSITYIGTETFKHCSSLPTITLGRFVTFINYGAFLQCSALTEIHSLNNVAPDISSGAFYSMPDSVAIYIPCGSTASYVSEWRIGRFTFIEEPGFVLDITASSNEHGSVEIVSEPTCDNPQAELLATANEGYHFDHWSNGSTDNPLTFTLTRDTAIVAYFENNAPDTIWRTVTVTTNAADVAEPYGSGIYADSSIVEIGYMMTDIGTQGGHWQFLGWSDGDSDNPRHILVTSDTAIVALFEWVADSTQGIDELLFFNSQFSIYPNPASMTVTVETDQSSMLTLTDAIGRECEQWKVENGKTTLDISPLSAGVYFVRLSTSPTIRKLIIR